MAFFSFGKKDKNSPDPAPPEAKTPAAPPRIQTPPAPVPKPTAPPGLMPTGGMPIGAATTQPMGMPRPGAAPSTGPHAMPASRATGGPTRSTQRIVLPTATTTLVTTKTTAVNSPAGRINLPMGMILRSLPPEVLAADVSQFEASGAAATEIGLPLNMILGQLPSGKVEIPLAELVPHFPPGYLQPTQSIAGYLPTLVNLPLMDVVMRIPPDLLALRPDQKDVDAAVINMADPFTEEILREQAEAARRGPETNIIDESQVKPAEEFVPRDQAPAFKTQLTPAAPPRPEGPPVLAPAPRPSLTAATAPVALRPGVMPPPPTPVRPASPTPPSPPAGVVRQVTPTLSGKLPVPARPQSPLLRGASTAPVKLPATAAPSFIIPPPTPVNPALARPTAALPMAVPAPRPLPQPQPPQPPLRPPSSPVTPSVPILPQSNSDTSQPEPPSAAKAPEPSTVKPGEPDPGAGELQRLAALAMKALADQEAAAAAALRANAETIGLGTVAVAGAVGASQLLPSEPAPALATVTAPVSAPPEPEPELALEPAAPEPKAEPKPEPEPEPEPQAELQPVTAPSRPFGSKSITAPMPTVVETPAPLAAPALSTPAPAETAPSIALNLNSCAAAELLQIPGCTQALAEAIVQHRAKIGSFKRVQDLLDVPGMNGAAYSALTGEEPPSAGIAASVGELLGFPPDQKLSLKDVTERIGCWPDVNGCVLSQKSGLYLVGHVPSGFDRAAVVAFAPRMFEAVNRSFSEIANKETDELIIPTSGTSFHIFRSHDLYLIIMSRLPQMPDRHAKIARMVLGGLSTPPS